MTDSHQPTHDDVVSDSNSLDASDWTFEGSDTQYLTHGLHNQPARMIPNKTLPWENAPENVEGTTGDLMANEKIVVVRAP